MKNKKFGLLSVVLVIVVVCVVIYFISRPQQQQLITQEFAQLPEKPKLIDEFHQNTRIYSMAFSPSDPALIAFGDENGTIKLWNRNITNKPAPILSHPGQYISIGFSPTGELLASAGWGKLVLWDVASRTKLNSLNTSNGQFAFSPDGHHLATVYNEVRLWDIRNPKKITEITTLLFNKAHEAKGEASAVDISPDGKWITIGYSHGTINILDLETEQLVKTLETSYYEMDFLKFSPDNKFLVAGGPVIFMDDYQKEWVSGGSKGYSKWEMSSWQRHGEVQRGNIDNLVFSPDARICMSANDQSFSGRGVELWSVASGEPITFLPTQARDAAFSPDGKILATGGEDGIIQLWELTPQQLETATPPTDLVHIIYYLSKHKEPSDITKKLDKTIREVQDFYADEMERHGFGRKTFSFETDENGKAKIYLVKEGQTNEFDLPGDAWIAFVDDIPELSEAVPLLNQAVGHKKTFWYPAFDGYTAKDNIWKEEIKGIPPGKIVYASINELNRSSVAYTLRDAFGIPYHPPQYEPNVLKRLFFRIYNMMPWGKIWAKMTRCNAEWLDKSRFFNPNQPFFDRPPKMDMRVSVQNDSDMRHFIFDVVDDNGIQQVQLFVPIYLKNQWWRKKFHDCKTLNGKDKATVAFEISDPIIYTVVLRMIDMHGNIATREFGIKEKTSETDKEP